VNSREAYDYVTVHRLAWYAGGRGAVGPTSMGRRDWWPLQQAPLFQRGNLSPGKCLSSSPWAITGQVTADEIAYLIKLWKAAVTEKYKRHQRSS